LQYKPDNYLQICLSYQDNGRQIEVIGDRQLWDLSL